MQTLFLPLLRISRHRLICCSVSGLAIVHITSQSEKSQEMDSVQVYQVLSISPNSSMELEMMLETEKGSRRLKAALSSRVNLCGTGLS